MRPFLARPSPRPGTRVAAHYTIPLSNLSPEDLEDEKKRLTLQAKTSFGAPPPPFDAWRVADGVLEMPRFYGLQRYGPAETDGRVDGTPIDLTFVGQLTPVQTRAWEAVSSKYLHADHGDGGVMVSLPCGFGKTVLATMMIARYARKACVLVHKGVIRDQWKACLEHFCPGVRVGFLQGKTWQVEGYDVVIAMVMTLAKRKYEPHVFDDFGLVVVDEAHHIAAPVLNQAMRFNARRIVGLSATKDRPDGLTPLLHWALGPEGFRVEREGEGVQVSVALFKGGCREVLTREGQPLVSVMINQLAKNTTRNAFLADRIAAYRRRQHRVVMVLSDRTEQLHTLRRMVAERGVPDAELGLFVGATREADRALQLARPVVFCTYAMANEGVDKKEADTCVMATPKGRVVQCIGRIQRPCETKQAPIVLDVADDVSVFVQLRWKRQRLYSKERYRVQVVEHDAPADEWF